MLKGQKIICISSIDWDFVWQGHQEIMSKFAQSGNMVLFIENTGVRTPKLKDAPRLKKRIINWLTSIKGFREEGKNLYIYSPIALPFPYSRIARFINKYLILRSLKRWIKAMGFYNPIIWTFLPTGTALDIINSIDNKLLVYYCIADFYKLVDKVKKLKKTENELIKNSDLVFVQGKVLEEKCKPLNENVYIFPFGVNIELFGKFKYDAERVPEDIKYIKKPIIGYIGGIHKHIDFKLIKFLAEGHPEWSIVLVGPIQTDIGEINKLPNIYLLGKKDFPRLPYYINEFDVCIIPYDDTEYTTTVYPTKLNEYHMLGKPVVSTDLPEVINFNIGNDNLVLIAKSYNEFENCILKALAQSNGISVSKRISSAKKNSWVARISQMSELMEEAMDRKSKTLPNWRVSFVNSYKLTRKRISKIILLTLGIYLLIFYTPLIWFLAKPLKISEVPQNADAIVVFAGGVGESGKAGQGYEERVEYAVELYKGGYANSLIFSSGQKHIFEEAEVMRMLAASLGVPENVIILEDDAENTYENVNLSKEIINKMGWHKILLVSSPYHMRRNHLVFNKVAKDIEVTYVPVTNSTFYSHPERDKRGNRIWKRISLEQIIAIAHEYLGIIYYWWKGYI